MLEIMIEMAKVIMECLFVAFIDMEKDDGGMVKFEMEDIMTGW